MTELIKLDENQIDFQIDLKEESFITHIDTNVSNRINISTLFSSSTYWWAMLKHFHDDEFRKVAQIEFDAIDDRDTWEIMNK
jgi:hypothetical protein